MKEIKELEGKKIAIMGGAGFIGHNLALKLKEQKAIPTVVDSLQVNSLGFYTSNYQSNPNSELFIAFINERLESLRKANIEMSVIDIRDYHAVCHCLDRIEPDAIIHLSAVAHANRSNKDPFSTFDHSMRTLENVLDASRTKKPHVIYFSSSMVYGDFDGEEVSEDRYCFPKGIYGALKYGAEKLVEGYNQVFDIPYTIIRPSALYGERCVSRRVGQAFIENALENKNLTINGDGTDALDFTYIQDLIQGVMLTLVNENARNEIFNITYGQGRTLNELAEMVLKEFDGLELAYNPRDGLMPERGTLSVEKAKSLLGYNPSYPLEKGFKKYIEWYKHFADSNPEYFAQNQ